MMDNPKLPQHKLIAYEVSLRLLEAVMRSRIVDSNLRNQALRAAKSACLNCAEGAGRVTPADKAARLHHRSRRSLRGCGRGRDRCPRGGGARSRRAGGRRAGRPPGGVAHRAHPAGARSALSIRFNRTPSC